MTARDRGAVLVPLTIAGSDPTGGAGLEADLKVFAAHELSGAAIATALTEQDTRAVYAVNATPAPQLERRLERLLKDVRIAGAKTGLLASAAQVRVVARSLKRHHVRTLVVDPVLAPTRGKPFLDGAGRKALWRELLPLATIVTPNVDEAAALLGTTHHAIAKRPERACAHLLESGAKAVLLKGGHGAGKEAVDVLFDGTHFVLLSLPRLNVKGGTVHGTGCALSAALVAQLVMGVALDAAVENAKRYVHSAIERSERIGRGRLRLGFGEPD
jgi:hydroxymethylpyrimidine/phosphomethylpyrimidine kinase